MRALYQSLDSIMIVLEDHYPDSLYKPRGLDKTASDGRLMDQESGVSTRTSQGDLTASFDFPPPNLFHLLRYPRRHSEFTVVVNSGE